MKIITILLCLLNIPALMEDSNGENKMAELNWLEEYFMKEAAAIAEKRERDEIINAAIDFMRSIGMSNEQINNFRNSVLNP